MAKIRLHKAMAKAGIASLRKSEQLILEGKVKVNGVLINTLGYLVDDTDVITLDQQVIKAEPLRYYILHKPKNVLSSVSDNFNRKTVVDFIETDVKIFPVGRLDKDTTGLLLLTNDGDLTFALTHPSFELEKKYHVTVAGLLSSQQLKQLESGVILDDGYKTAPAIIESVIKDKKEITTTFSITVIEGKNRLIRRMVEAIGSSVLKLHRYQVAFLTLDKLPIGTYRPLKPFELKQLKQIAKRKKD